MSTKLLFEERFYYNEILEVLKQRDEFYPFERFYCYVLTDSNYIKLANLIIEIKKYSFQDLLNYFQEYCNKTNCHLVGIASKKYNYEYYEKLLEDNGYRFEKEIKDNKWLLYI